MNVKFKELVKLIEEFGPIFNQYDRQRLARLEEKVDQILRALTIIVKMEIKEMHSTEEIIALANQASSDTESLRTLISGLRGQVASLLSGSSVSPTTQAAIDQVFSRLEANHAAAMSAINNDGPGFGASTEDTAVGTTSGSIDTTETGPLVNVTAPEPNDGVSGATGASSPPAEVGATGATG